MKFGSLFSGIGGMDLGLERAGMECAWQVEIDEYATKVLEKHWPNVPRWRDIADFIADAKEFKRNEVAVGKTRSCKGANGSVSARGYDSVECVDGICGGFPCQPVSVAGRRDGMADERWLWDSFCEVIRIIRPRYVLVENVPGLLSANSGRAFGTVLRDLAQCGYDASWDVLPAAAFGAPHLRKRVFIVAYTQHNPCGNQATCDTKQGQPKRSMPGGDGEARTTADASESRLPQRQQSAVGRGIVRQERPTITADSWRSTQPTIRRGDYGTAHRVDRLRCLGNAVVPQVAELIGKQIIKAVAQRGGVVDL